MVGMWLGLTSRWYDPATLREVALEVWMCRPDACGLFFSYLGLAFLAATIADHASAAMGSTKMSYPPTPGVASGDLLNKKR